MKQAEPKLDLAPGCSLSLVEISEPRNNDLHIVVAEVGPSAHEEMTQLGLARRVGPFEGSRTFELTWYCYVAYSIRNESYVIGEPDSPDLRERAETAFGAFVKATTFASDEYPGPLTHWSLYTNWHCIDVISVDPPEIRQLDSTDATPGTAKRHH